MELEVRRLSAPGRSAIGILELVGPGAAAQLARWFRPLHGVPVSERDWLEHFRGRAVHGVIASDDGTTIDDVVCIVVDAEWPRVLLTPHGNPLLIDELERFWLGRGARPGRAEAALFSAPPGAPPEERVRSAIIPLLGGLRSEGAVSFFLEQGNLAPEARGLAAWVRRNRRRDEPPPAGEIAAALSAWPIARGLLEPPRVCLWGPPNAGKSTLFNALLDRQRVVEHSEPGTTRDVIEELTLVGDFPLRLVDGAGVRTGARGVEREGIRRLRLAREGADLTIELIPPEVQAGGAAQGSAGSSAYASRDGSSKAASGAAVGRPPPESAGRGGIALKILSRSDQIPAASPAPPGALRVSSHTGEGVEELRHRIVRALYGTDRMPSGPVACTSTHVSVLAELRSCAGDPEARARAWSRL